MIYFAQISDFMLRFALSNFAVALPVCLAAWWAEARAKRPAIAHLLWLVALVMLVTPPLVSFPLAGLPGTAGPDHLAGAVAASLDSTRPIGGAGALSILLDWKYVAIALWLIGSAGVAAWTVACVIRFDRLLRATSNRIEPSLALEAEKLAGTLGLKRLPAVVTTTGTISPMVWWIGGRVRIYVPRSMIERMSPSELVWILAHELGHVRRRDHLVRWLECIVCIALWWNPLAWWARRHLRTNEEMCCDAFVISKIEGCKYEYASALVSATEILVTPALRLSAMASNVNGGGFIERRIKMILSRRSIADTPHWLRTAVIVGAAALVPIGFTTAQDADDLGKVQDWLEAGVNATFLTKEQADVMLRALRVNDGQRVAVSLAGSEKVKAAIVEAEEALEQARADGNEEYALEIEERLVAMQRAFENAQAEAVAAGLEAADGTIHPVAPLRK